MTSGRSAAAYMGTELLAKARMAIVDGESEERKEVIGELVAAG